LKCVLIKELQRNNNKLDGKKAVKKKEEEETNTTRNITSNTQHNKRKMSGGRLGWFFIGAGTGSASYFLSNVEIISMNKTYTLTRIQCPNV
jgi:hypothetical protein